MQALTAGAPTQPHVTVDDVWHGALPAATTLIAGGSSLRREVGWCTTLRTRPPAFEPLRGGELLLIDPSTLRAFDPHLSLPRLLTSVAGQGVAGVAVRGSVPDDARRVAEDTGLPLPALPAVPPL